MDSPPKCYVCDTATIGKVHVSVYNIRSKHTKIPIAEILKRIQSGVETIRARDGSNKCVLCRNCMDTINRYDEAYERVQVVEKQLKDMIVRTEEHYKVSEYQTSTQPASTAIGAETDPFEWEEMQVDHSVHFDDESIECVDDTSEPEEIFESDGGDANSDDSFSWPRAATLKRMRMRPKDGPNIKKKPNIYKCIECPAEYRSKYDMQLHLASHRNSQFRCGICYMRITKGRESIEHENLHSSRSDLQCIFCEESFDKKGDLALHMESHNGDIYTICYICGIRIRTQTMDGRHLKSHLGIKDYECETCSRRFVDKQHLQRHLRTHTGEKPYQCPNESCKKRFSSYNNMREHSFIHTNKRPGYFRECTLCGKLFRRAGLLAEHYKKNHDSIASTASTSK